MKSISLYLSSSTQDKKAVFSVFTSFQIFKFFKKGVFYSCLLNVDLHKHYLLEWAQFSFEQQQNIPPQKDIQNIPPQNMPLLCIDYFETQHLKNSNCRKRFSLNSSCLPENSCQKELNCHKSPPWRCHQLRKIDSRPRRGDLKLTPHPDTLRRKPPYLPPVLLRAQSSFLETTYSPLRSLHPPSLSFIKVVVNI